MEPKGWLPCSEERAKCFYLSQINPVNASQFSLIKTHLDNIPAITPYVVHVVSFLHIFQP